MCPLELNGHWSVGIQENRSVEIDYLTKLPKQNCGRLSLGSSDHVTNYCAQAQGSGRLSHC